MSTPGEHSRDRELRRIFQDLGVDTRRCETWVLWEAARVICEEGVGR